MKKALWALLIGKARGAFFKIRCEKSGKVLDFVFFACYNRVQI